MFNSQFFSEEIKHQNSSNAVNKNQCENWKQKLEQDVRKRLTNKDANLRKYYHLLTDKIMIEQTLYYCDGNKSKAAKMLGMSRVTLRLKIEEYESFFK